MNTQSTIPAVKLTEMAAIVLGSFEGTFKRFQTSAYGDLVRGGLDKPVAHKVAMDYGSDLGRACATDGKFGSKVGKANAEGASRLKLSGSSIIATTHTMSIVRVAGTIGDLADESLLATRKMPPLSDDLNEYLAECLEWTESGDRTFTEKR